MIQLKVFGPTPPCAKCKEAEKRARKVVESYSDRVEVVKHDALSEEGIKFGIMHTPTVAIDNKVIAKGKVPKEEEIEKALQKELGE